MNEADQIFLSEQILALMRHAAEVAGRLNEPFITVRTLLLAILDDPEIGAALVEALPREKLEEYVLTADAAKKLLPTRIPEPHLPTGERAAMLRFSTLAFKTPDGAKSVWLSPEAMSAWHEGAKRVEEGGKYQPKHLAFGILADAMRQPGMFNALKLSPGAVNEAILAIE
jgi:hypothetical protein